uniref:Uncharacterized protein n=1 Tax=Caenorhabditis japonica TaxID=281687 RepID=A0A8R1DHQ1_CAEJA
MRAIGEYFSDLMGCGPEGWCAFRCCPSERQLARNMQSSHRVYPNPAAFASRRSQGGTGSSKGSRKGYTYLNRSPARTTTSPQVIEQCANACMPRCSSRCLQRYNQIVASFMNSLTAIDVMGQPVNEGGNRKNIRFSPSKTIECRDECMPYCTPQCLDAYSIADRNSQPKICKAGSIVYYPEQGKAEILKKDGTVVVEVMESG